MQQTLKIRLAALHDATAIAHVRRQAILSKAATHYDQALLIAWADATNFPDRVRHFEQNISDPGCVALVAESGNDLCGFAIADLVHCELQALYSKPNPIGGIGRALLTALEKRAFATVPFLVCDASLNAERFYKVNGYLEECRKDHVAPRSGVISRVVQMKKLRPANQEYA